MSSTKGLIGFTNEEGRDGSEIECLNERINCAGYPVDLSISLRGGEETK